MDQELLRDLTDIAARHGLDIWAPRGPESEMRECVRALDVADDTHVASESEARALVENLQLVIRVTCAVPNQPESIRRQANRPRWRFLRRVDPRLADAYVDVLLFLDVPVPSHLL